MKTFAFAFSWTSLRGLNAAHDDTDPSQPGKDTGPLVTEFLGNFGAVFEPVSLLLVGVVTGGLVPLIPTPAMAQWALMFGSSRLFRMTRA